ncbi:SF1B family DNA helicase RecD2 [Desulfopila inferna]|uniref:SF1B family DNA helicase RecD2 n=1 Tax=Desulfopila inferna TaxID=468528 RepID=UPI001965CA21|nr:AAA family ATPase [Desulfopila inferna]MBM9606395.1 AAA family ATPase [Desulfopila inferna]
MTFITETLKGIVQRVTYHNPENGWSVLKVQSYANPGDPVTVTVHQTTVFAGATMEFHGSWTVHPQFGRQFKAINALEKKPASVGALEKYLGSGLIKGVGPKTAGRIVRHFGHDTLTVFEEQIERLTEVPGIASGKLTMIKEAWYEHRMIREVMIFLQGHGISTLFAVRIYKRYGDRAITMVSEDPYRLARDFYGIGFFSADEVALSIGLAKDSEERIMAAIRHVLASSREQGHCYLTREQIGEEVEKLLEIKLAERLDTVLKLMEDDNQLRLRMLGSGEGGELICYYSKTLYYDELTVAARLHRLTGRPPEEDVRMKQWIERYCTKYDLQLSGEQAAAVAAIVGCPFSVLTGGPGCGKTTTTLVIVRLLESMKKKVLLAAPTGRAAQRMGEVIGRQAKTLHRLLEWQQGSFLRNEEQPLESDFLIVDECSMLDISLTASLLKAVPEDCNVLFIGDADQLPSVGAGNVLRDIIDSGKIPCFHLTEVFRQAKESFIVEYAHQINRGEIPRIESPFKYPQIWKDNTDCLFLDSEQATNEQLSFVGRMKRGVNLGISRLEGLNSGETPYEFRTSEVISSAYESEFEVPAKFRHVDLERLCRAGDAVEELKALLKKVHPWSTLHYGLTAVQSVVQLYREWIPRYYGRDAEIQILSPMTRGTLGTANLNTVIQQAVNPAGQEKAQIQVGERIYRSGDRVIHRRNNYDLQVFNGDIGIIQSIDSRNLTMMISFFPDGREVEYQKDDIVELDLAYAITIHKSQGSEFAAVIIPVLTQHFKMLYRNLIYTGLTRARKLAVLVGTRKALAMAVRRQDTGNRQTALKEILQSAEH